RDAPNNTIGGATSGARNVITSISVDVRIQGAGATGNLVQGNFIGIDVTGTTPLGGSLGGGTGVAIFSASSTTIGGTTPGARNIISGGGGLFIGGDPDPASNNLVQGNFIGTDANRIAAVPKSSGILIGRGVFGTTIGGTTPGAGNLISGNRDF